MANPIRSIFSALNALIRKILGRPKKKKLLTKKHEIDKLYSDLSPIHKEKKTCSKSTLEKIVRRKKKKKKKDHDKDHDDKD